MTKRSGGRILRACGSESKSTKQSGRPYERRISICFGHENHKKELDFQIRVSFRAVSVRCGARSYKRREPCTAKSGQETAADDECPDGEGNRAISIISVLTFNPASSEISKLDELRPACVGIRRRNGHGVSGEYVRAQIISQNYATRSLF